MRSAWRSVFTACVATALTLTGLVALPASADPTTPAGVVSTDCVDGYVAQYETTATYGRLIALNVKVSRCDGGQAPYNGTWTVNVGSVSVSLNNGHYGSVYFYGRDQVVLPGYDSVYDATLTYTPSDPGAGAGAPVTFPLTLRSAPLPVVDATGYATVDKFHPGKLTLYAAAQHTGASTALNLTQYASGSIEIWTKGRLLQTVPLTSHYPPAASACPGGPCSASAELSVDGVEGDEFTMKYSGDALYAPSTGVVTAGDTRTHRKVEIDHAATSWRDLSLRVHVTSSRASFFFDSPYTLWVDGVARVTFTLDEYLPAGRPVDSWAYINLVPGAAPVGADPVVAWPMGPAIELPPIAAGTHEFRVTSPATNYLAPVDVSQTFTLAASPVTFIDPMTASSSSVRVGDPVRFSSRVTDVNGSVLNGIPVVLERQVGAGWQSVARTTTKAGAVLFKVAVSSSGTYRMRGEAIAGYEAAKWPQGYASQASVTAVTVPVALDAPKFSVYHPVKGATTTVRTYVLETATGQGANGAVVAFQRQSASGVWVTAGTATSKAGVAALKVVVTDGGRWRAALVTSAGPFRGGASKTTSMLVARKLSAKLSGSGLKRVVTAKVSPSGKVQLLARKSGAWKVVKTVTAKSVSGVGTARFTVTRATKRVTYKVLAVADMHAASAVASVIVPARR